VREVFDEGGRLRAPTTTRLESDHHQLATASGKKLWVGVLFVTACSLGHNAVLGRGACPSVAVGCQGRAECDVHGKLRASPARKTLCEDFDPTLVSSSDAQVHVLEERVKPYNGASLSAHAGERPLHWRSAALDTARVRTSGPVEAALVEHAPASLASRLGHWEWQAEAF